MVLRSYVGAPVKRKEDPRLITGSSVYVDDLKLPGIVHTAIVRSPHPHATITSIDATEARAMPGVVAVVTARDLAPGFEIFNLGGSQTTALIDLVHWIAAELDVEPAIEMLPDQPGDVPITYADVSKAGRLLGYAPKVPIREGLKRFVAWYRSSA